MSKNPYLQTVKDCESEEELDWVIDKAYSKSFEAGYNNGLK